MTAMINQWNGRLSQDLPKAEPALFTQTVPRHLVHRTAGSEVFVTGLRVTGHNTFEVGARWPGSHSFYGPITRDSHDPMLLVECLRQAGLLIAHVAFEVPIDFMFITHEKRFAVLPAGLRTAGTQPVDILINVTAHDIRRRGRGFAGMLFEYRCFRDGMPIARAAIRWSCVSAAGYARLRGEHLNATSPPVTGCRMVTPELVGRRHRRDVVIAHEPERRRAWRVRLDPDHPVIFDHSVDHVPGMAAVEAARQAALIVVGRPHALPVAGDFSLHRYVEFDEPCLVHANLDDGIEGGLAVVRVVLEQGGHTAAEGTLEMLLSGA
ncbi:MAG TPA: ScbA/BarX family gamma-butyrolactone biosynthesis protein [Actinophytocola sp.]|uniref:ScbA/BarX family gamma-butyrolactone biosynthesis protein n=1 Tax=Actinophytocola sp. TaxID=1872138 RepID=UPI002DDD4CB9|nr:ScbA/BarX family gamma-butyrolactone biosynthesis protein [Actinophytocola sp.]HEV2780665.1 ScbA/BarX family gamma-butyrolactone biosynthesis protein [Actinophytocola sp.]